MHFNINESITIIIAIWGAILSTILFVIKIIEFLRKLKIESYLKYMYFDTIEKEIIKPFIYFHIINSSSNAINIKGIFIVTFKKIFSVKYNKKYINIQQKQIRISPKDSYVIQDELTEMKSDYETLISKNNLTKNKFYAVSVKKYNNKMTNSKKIERVKNLNSFINEH
jgi:hypothetical protein